MKQNKVSIFLLLSILSRNNEYTNFFNIDLALERKNTFSLLDQIFIVLPHLRWKGRGGGHEDPFPGGRHDGRKQLENLVNALNLTDTWRRKHPNKIGWTHKNSNFDRKSRTDKIYTNIDRPIIQSILNDKTLTWSDHKATLTVLGKESTSKHIKTQWKFNNTLLQDDIFNTSNTCSEDIRYKLISAIRRYLRFVFSWNWNSRTLDHTPHLPPSLSPSLSLSIYIFFL